MKHIVFDFDGTLAASKGLAIEAYNRVALKRGFRPIEPEQVAALSALSIPERLKALGVPLHQMPGVVLEMKRYCREAGERLQPEPGIPAALAALRAGGRRLSIVSSNRTETIARFVQRHGLGEFAQVLTGNKLFGKHALLQRLMKLGGEQPHELLYVGDELRDLEACRRCGVAMLAVAWGYDAPKLLAAAGPAGLAHTPAEMAAWLLAEQRRMPGYF